MKDFYSTDFYCYNKGKKYQKDNKNPIEYYKFNQTNNQIFCPAIYVGETAAEVFAKFLITDITKFV